MLKKVLSKSGGVAVPVGGQLWRFGAGCFVAGMATSFVFHHLKFPIAFGCVALVVVIFWLAPLFGRRVLHTDLRLLNREKNYRDFFAHAIEGIFRTTPDGHYIAVNDALARIYGYDTPDDLLRALTDIATQLYIDPTRREAFMRLMAENDQVTDFISEVRRADGARIWITENARAVRDWAGHIICYEGTVEDITAKFETERRMQDALHEAEAANRAKRAFLATMSHELRTPLNAIIGFSEILKDEMLGRIAPPTYRDYASDIHVSGVRLLAIINDILDASRLEGGTIVIDPVPNLIVPIVQDAVVVARNLAGDRRNVAFEIPDNLPGVNVDGKRLCQCLAKILTNAFKFTPEDGEVSVRVVLDVTGGVRLSVIDTGIGMDPSKIAAALQPFRQLDGTLARRFGGTGLGLSITKTLVELHGGQLLIDSAVGYGTTVTIALPAARTILPQA
ncbi:MAG: ATP-binding protein [Rhizomicrobium sp.]